jgi:hypothetical protein
MSGLIARSLEHFEEFLRIQDRPIESFPIKKEYVKLLFIADIYGLNDRDTVEFLEDSLRGSLGLQHNLNQSTVWRKRNTLNEDDQEGRAAIRKAAKRAVFECCAAGKKVPQRVLAVHEIPANVGISNRQIKREDEQAALRNWVKWFFDKILTALTYHRDSETYPYRRYIGLCAHCALQTIAPNDAINTADRLYDRESIPSGESLTNNIRRLLNADSSVEKREFPKELQVQFEDCYRRFFQEANRLGFFSNKKQLVADVTHIPTTGSKDSSEKLTGGSGSGRKPATYGKHSWAYQFLGIPDSDAPFIRSIVPVSEENQEQHRLDVQLANAVADPSLNVDLVLCDKGYYRTDVVDVCRKHLDNAWVICAKFAGEIDHLVSNAPKGKVVSKRNVTFGDPPMRNSPSMVAYPNTDGENQEQRGLSEFNKEDDQWKHFLSGVTDRSHIAYLTDLRLEPEKIRKIHVSYNQRATVESAIGQVRDTFLPHTESMDAVVRTYLMSLAGLFYNLHHLIKRTLSPNHGVPLSPSGKELLTVIRDVALS